MCEAMEVDLQGHAEFWGVAFAKLFQGGFGQVQLVEFVCDRLDGTWFFDFPRHGQNF
ncbi:MAG: hypothetical protein JWR26_917 [Pedosphaera sp.]|nr:hypothetical protein [Pedosphaera sp.]